MNVMPYVSNELKTELANQATAEVRAYIRERWQDSQSYNGVYPRVERDGIGVGIAEEYEYLRYQNGGFETFTMTSLRGKVIPMRIGGKTIFRVANHIGEFDGRRAMYMRRDSDGVIRPHDEPRRRWTHPGLEPTHFIQQSIRRVLRWRRNEIINNAKANIRRMRRRSR